MRLSGVKQINPALSSWLDWIRALAAIEVFAGHGRAFCFVNDFNRAGLAGFLIKALFFVTSLGHQAVIVFFVLSGFLVGGSLLNEFRQTGNMQIRAYAIARVARIHSVLVPALVLGWVADWLGSHVMHVSAVYEHGYFSKLLWWNVPENLNVPTFLGNVACLQRIFVPMLGSNGPLWSLSNEFWYYLLFPAMLMAVWPGLPWRRRWLGAVATIGLLWMLGGLKDLYFLFWLAGVGVRLAPKTRTPPVWAALVLLGGALLAAKAFARSSGLWEEATADAVVTVAFSLLLWSASQRAARMPLWLSKCGQQLATSSYTLYACHFPLLVLLASVCVMTPGWTLPREIQDPKTWAIYGGFLLSVGCACFLLSLCTERKHHQLKRWLAKVGPGKTTRAV